MSLGPDVRVVGFDLGMQGACVILQGDEVVRAVRIDAGESTPLWKGGGPRQAQAFRDHARPAVAFADVVGVEEVYQGGIGSRFIVMQLGVLGVVCRDAGRLLVPVNVATLKAWVRSLAYPEQDTPGSKLKMTKRRMIAAVPQRHMEQIEAWEFITSRKARGDLADAYWVARWTQAHADTTDT